MTTAWLAFLAVIAQTALAAAPAEPITPIPIGVVTRDPARFDGQKVTLIGQIHSREQLAAVPAPPREVRAPFALRAGNATIWVSEESSGNTAGKASRLSSADAGRWAAITGHVRHRGNAVWVEGLEAALVSEPRQGVEVALPALPAPPVEVVFSSPTDGEADVGRDSRIRIQFSAEIDPATLTNRIRMAYSQSDSIERGEPQPPPLTFSFNYSEGTRALEIRPSTPLERFRQITLELLDGIKGTDGAVVKAWTLTFSTGGV